MTQRLPDEEDRGPSQIIEVPASARPPLGTGGRISYDTALRRAEAALSNIIASQQSELDSLIRELVTAVAGLSNPIEADSAAKLLNIANDFRGIAAPLGAPLVGEIANAIHGVLEDMRLGPDKTAKLIQMLLQPLRIAHEAIIANNAVDREKEMLQVLQHVRELTKKK